MLALVNTPSAPIAVELNEVPEPVPMPDEAIVEVHTFSLNRGELALCSMHLFNRYRDTIQNRITREWIDFYLIAQDVRVHSSMF